MLTPESCIKAPLFKSTWVPELCEKYLECTQTGWHWYKAFMTHCVSAQYWSHICKYHVWLYLHCVVLWLKRIAILCTVIKWQVNHLRSYSPLRSFIPRNMSWILCLLDDYDGDEDSDLYWLPTMMMMIIFIVSVILVMILSVIMLMLMIFKIRKRTTATLTISSWLQCGQTQSCHKLPYHSRSHHLSQHSSALRAASPQL